MEAETSLIVQCGPSAIVVLRGGGRAVGLDANLRAVVTAADPLSVFLEEVAAVGFRHAPDFIVAAFDEPVLRLLVRGDISVTVVNSEGEFVAPSAVGVSTWNEHVISAATDLLVRVDGAVHRFVLGPRDAAGPDTAGVGSARSSSPIPAPARSEEPAAVPTGADETILPFSDPPLEAAPIRPAQIAPPPPIVESDPTTSQPSTPHAAESGDLYETQFRGGRAPVAAPAEGAVAVSSSGSALIAGVPPPPDVAGPSALSPPGDRSLGEHDGLTVLGSDLTALRKSLGGAGVMPAPHQRGGTVQAVLCVNGHSNAPASAQCQTCRGPIADRRIHHVPRPIIGRLLFESGMTVNIDRRLVIGRRPTVAPGSDVADLPALVTLPDPETLLSRTHTEIRVDGWDLMVVDLRSENGTFVVPAGHTDLLRLRAHEPYPLTSGMRISFADVTACRYEVGAG